MGYVPGEAYALLRLGEILLDQGELSQARSCYQQSMQVRPSGTDRAATATCLEGLARIAAAEGEAQEAARLLAHANAIRADIRAPRPPAQHARLDALEETLRASLGEVAWQSACEEGQGMANEDLRPSPAVS
jgi:hypothetical protein